MPHDSALYDTVTGHNSPAQTKAVEDAQNAATRDKYQAAQRSAARQFSGFTGGPADPYLPVLDSISPSTKANNSGGFTLTCTGSNFNEDSKIFWGAYECPTVFVSSTSLTTQMSAGVLASAGTVQVSVKTDSSASATKPFVIT